MRPLLSLFVPALMSACHSSPVTQTASSADVSQAASLTGKWHASSSGLAIDMTIDQHGDSLVGSGTYTVVSNATMGCGGETIPASGPLTLSGKLNGSSFEGRMSFASTWTPPYLGTFFAPDSLNGHFMSVDRGGCTLILVRKH
jgi:hypothetical protein